LDLGTDVEGPGDGTSGLDAQPDVPLVPCGDNWSWEFFGIQTGTSLKVGQTYPIQVRMFNLATGEMVGGEKVEFSLAGTGDASFGQASATTDAGTGVASVELDMGTSLGVSYTLTAKSRCMDPMTITLISVAPEQGTLIVTVQVAEEVTSAWPSLTYQMFLDNTIPMCGAYNLKNPTGLPFPVPVQTMEVEIDDALANVGYVVAVVAYNPEGLPVGGGCTQDIVVLPGKTVSLTVTVLPLSLNPVGQYLVDVELDVEAILGGMWRDVGQPWAELFQKAGGLIADKVMEDILLFFPDGIPEACGNVDLELRTGILIALGAGYPPAVVTEMVGEANARMKQLLESVTFKATLDIQETAVPGEYAGKLAVQAIEFPGVTFANEVFNVGEVKLELADTDFVAGTEGFDKLVFQMETWPVRPGKLFLYAFLNAVMPAYELPASVKDYAVSLFVCQSLMSQVSFATITCLNRSLQSLVDSCNTASGNLWIHFYDLFPELKKPQVLQVDATLTMLDDSANLAADRLQGEFSATLIHDGTALNEVILSVQGARK
jgi:hypothetical protein